MTNWHRKDFPLWMKVNLFLGSSTMILSAYLFEVYATECFEDFDVSGRISDPPLNGSALKIVKPFGWYGGSAV
jgi:hypothetical protein